ncbi:MAG: sigma-54-dependent Fis family transcriptional regulator [Pseudomonadales bacterium]
MPASKQALFRRSSDRLPSIPVDNLFPHDEVVGHNAGQHPTFADFLIELSGAFSSVPPDAIESEILKWLDQLAERLGAERCTVSEFYEPEKRSQIMLRWLVGDQLAPFISSEDNWIRDSLVGGQSISISSLDDVPAEAVATRQLLEEIGIRSGLWVPMLVEGFAIGGIGLTVLSHERAWPAQIIQQCRLVADVLGNALLRRRRTMEIEERSEFEALITDISVRFLNDDGDTDALTDGVLRELGELLCVDRVSFLKIDTREQSLIPTRQWIADNIQDDYPIDYTDVTANFPWLVGKIMANEQVVIDNIDQFPDAANNERQYCEDLGIQSFTMVPTTLGGEVKGALALDNISKPKIWDDSILRRLQIVAHIISNAQDRARSMREIAELHRFENVLSKMSTAFVNLRPEHVDGKIEADLGTVAASLGADVVTLLQPEQHGEFVVTHEWFSQKFNGDGFKNTHVGEVFPWLLNRLMQNEPLVISALSDFPAEAAQERSAMEQQGLESVLWVPFQIRGELAGYLAINAIIQRTWPDALVQRLRLLGEVFGEALNRRDAELRLQKSFKRIKLLKEQLQQENLFLRQEVIQTQAHDEITGDSAALRATMAKVEQVAATDATVLILGETGTGKALISQAIHNLSQRSDKLMVTVNCAVLPSSLVEAELFGREKGAYTGALSRERGRFEIADGSTILLDEVGELPLELQAKLLRVLQDGVFERLGSSKSQHVNVRVLAATNRDLAEDVEEKKFREDLYYRLNVFPIEVPPLRDRIEDVPQLVWRFVQEFSQSMGKSIDMIPHTTMDSLKAYNWPGNIREVRNIIERAMIISKGPVLEVELPSNATTLQRSSKRLTDIEREHILAVLESSGWRIRGVGRAADILGLKPTTLEARMKKLGIKRSSMA